MFVIGHNFTVNNVIDTTTLDFIHCWSTKQVIKFSSSLKSLLFQGQSLTDYLSVSLKYTSSMEAVVVSTLIKHPISFMAGKKVSQFVLHART